MQLRILRRRYSSSRRTYAPALDDTHLFMVMAMATGRLGATRASATTFLMPPVALLLGVVVRGEQVAPLSVLGGVVCIAGAWLLRHAQTEAPRDPATERPPTA